MSLKWSPGCGCCGGCPNCSGTKGTSYTVDVLDGNLYSPSCSFGELASTIDVEYTPTTQNQVSCVWQNNTSGAPIISNLDMLKSGSCNSLVVTNAFIVVDGVDNSLGGIQSYPSPLSEPTGHVVHLLFEFGESGLGGFGHFGYVLYTYTVPGSGGFACSDIDDVTFTYSSEAFTSPFTATHTWSSWSPRVTFNP